MLKYTAIKNFTSYDGTHYESIPMSYEVFGQGIDSGAPVVMVCHALTGNSAVAGDDGWWKGLISDGNVVDTTRYSVLCFNIPGNGYDGKLWGDDYVHFVARDVARMLYMGAREIGVSHLHSLIGCSMGACIAWEMAVEYPDFASQLVSVGGDCKSTDWVIALSELQLQSLSRGDYGMHDARMLTMMFFRTPQSFSMKFDRSNHSSGIPNVVSWLRHHGDKLGQRFDVDAYRFLSHLTGTVDVSWGRETMQEALSRVKSRVIQVGISSDMYFQPYENIKVHDMLLSMGKDSHYRELDTMHGHDGFLIEFDKLQELLKVFF